MKSENVQKPENNRRDDIVIGRNSVSELLKSGRTVDHVLVANTEKKGTVLQILSKCRELGIVVKEVSPTKLDFMSSGGNHQGVIAACAVHEYSQLSDLFETAKEKGQDPFFIICDEIEDPHNLGAIIRTAEAAGAHGVIIPKRRSAALSFSVSKASAGALEHMKVVKVSNLAQTIDELKKEGVWIYGAHMDGQPWFKSDLTGAVALVIGSEGSGIGPLIRQKCDVLLSIPMCGKINSLNASVAGGILMYEVAKQRNFFL